MHSSDRCFHNETPKSGSAIRYRCLLACPPQMCLVYILIYPTCIKGTSPWWHYPLAWVTFKWFFFLSSKMHPSHYALLTVNLTEREVSWNVWLTTGQYWFRQSLGSVRWQAITSTTIGQDPWFHMASLCHKVLNVKKLPHSNVTLPRCDNYSYQLQSTADNGW